MLDVLIVFALYLRWLATRDESSVDQAPGHA
jgi:hypothetical protein